MATYVRLLLTNHDWRLEVDVNDNQEFVVAWLEEEMFDIAKQDICER